MRTLTVRVTSEASADGGKGYIVTLDDIGSVFLDYTIQTGPLQGLGGGIILVGLYVVARGALPLLGANT